MKPLRDWWRKLIAPIYWDGRWSSEIIGPSSPSGASAHAAAGSNGPDALRALALDVSNEAWRGEAWRGVRGGGSVRRAPLRWVGASGRVALREFDFESDAEAVCAFQQDTYEVNFPEFQFTRSFATAFRHDLRRAWLDSQHGLFVLDDGGIVGFLWLVVCENNWTSERYGYVNNVYVAPARRGDGLGRALMQQTDEFFRSRQVHRVRLTVTSSNSVAASLYLQAGYEVTRWEMEKEL